METKSLMISKIQTLSHTQNYKSGIWVCPNTGYTPATNSWFLIIVHSLLGVHLHNVNNWHFLGVFAAKSKWEIAVKKWQETMHAHNFACVAVFDTYLNHFWPNLPSTAVHFPSLINESSQMREERHAAGEPLLTSAKRGGRWKAVTFFVHTLEPCSTPNLRFQVQIFTNFMHPTSIPIPDNPEFPTHGSSTNVCHPSNDSKHKNNPKMDYSPASPIILMSLKTKNQSPSPWHRVYLSTCTTYNTIYIHNIIFIYNIKQEELRACYICQGLHC